MTDPLEGRARQWIDEHAAAARPEDLSKIDLQFEERLRRLEAAGDKAPNELAARLRLFWEMLKAPDDVVPWRAKGLLMAATVYFVSPIDLIPDALGRAGTLDDALVVAIVHRRVSKEIEAFRKSRVG
jgi:uncharacterized membrane protein YkvA (DUF1232 family)